ncbi:MAG: flavin monoamine oxidase family protein [Fimbriimonadaceae bacterium]
MKPRKTLGKTPLGHQLRDVIRVAHAANQLDDQRGATADPLGSVDELLSRREALRLAALGATGLLTGGAFANATRYLDPGIQNRRNVRVAIIGAGMAGLNAAYHLKRAGITAQIYEAQPRAGGRIYTRHDVMGDGLITEVGASFIDSDHTEMLNLAKTFDVGMWDTMAESERSLQPAYYFGGKMRWNNEVMTAFRPFARKVAQDAKDAVLNNCKDFNRLGWELDQISLAEYLQRIGMEGWLRDFMTVAYVTEDGTEADTLSAMQFISEVGTATTGPFDLFGSSDQRYHTRGGNHQIPQALVNELRDQIHYHMWLEEVRMDSSGAYELTFAKDRAPVTVKADYVIMTIPFTILRTITMNVEMSPLKRRAIRELNYGANAKLIVGFKERFWRSQGTHGLFFCDLPIQSGWDSGWRQPTTESSITVFYGGKAAVRQVEYPLAQRVKDAVGQLDMVFPGALQNFNEKRTQFNWPHFPFVMGSYAAYAVGQQSAFGGLEAEPVGRMLFAGEHTHSEEQGFMNSAAMSGKHAAQSLLRAVR